MRNVGSPCPPSTVILRAFTAAAPMPEVDLVGQTVRTLSFLVDSFKVFVKLIDKSL